MEVLDAIRLRRAVRSYSNEPIDDATIRRLIDAAVLAPSAVNSQPWAFVVVQGKELLRSLSDRAKAHWLATSAADPHFAHLREMLSPPSFNIFYDAGTLLVICAVNDGRAAAEDCCLAAENLMLAATSLGLATCPIGLARPLLNLRETKAELGVPADVFPVLPIIVGRPRGETPPTPRAAPRILSWKRAAGAAGATVSTRSRSKKRPQ